MSSKKCFPLHWKNCAAAKAKSKMYKAQKPKKKKHYHCLKTISLARCFSLVVRLNSHNLEVVPSNPLTGKTILSTFGSQHGNNLSVECSVIIL
jgi:hypothetical protein